MLRYFAAPFCYLGIEHRIWTLFVSRSRINWTSLIRNELVLHNLHCRKLGGDGPPLLTTRLFAEKSARDFLQLIELCVIEQAKPTDPAPSERIPPSDGVCIVAPLALQHSKGASM